MGLARSKDIIDSTVLRMEKTYPAYFGTYGRFDEIKEELKLGCAWESRIAFLNQNGYEVNRENVVNNNLHAIQSQLWAE